MRTLQFTVEGQMLRKDGDFSNIIKGSKGFLKCRFDFLGRDLMDAKIIALFERNKKEYAVPVDIDGTCMVPDEVTDEPCYKLRIVGVRDNCRMYTDSVTIRQEG